MSIIKGKTTAEIIAHENAKLKRIADEEEYRLSQVDVTRGEYERLLKRVDILEELIDRVRRIETWANLGDY